MHLTYPDKDKLLALSGIAKRMSRSTSQRYVAGMFGGNLLHQLLWTSPFNATRSSTWRAPTWSWTSMDGEIRMNDIEYKAAALASVASVDLQPSDSQNLFGRLHSASLRLMCRSIKLEHSAVVNPDGNYHLYEYYQIELPSLDQERPHHVMEWVPDDRYESTTTVGPFLVAFTELREGQGEAPLLQHETEMSLHCLKELVASTAITNFYFGGLVLEPLPQHPGVFRRLGKVMISLADSISKKHTMELLKLLADVPEKVLMLV